MKFVSAAHLTGGGTISGHLTIEGDLTVTGAGAGYSYSEVLTGDMKITNALNTIGLEINQDTNYSALKIDADGVSNANTVNIDAPTTTTGNVMRIADCDDLTTGRIAYLHSNSDSTGVRNLVIISNDHASATGTTGLKIQQDSTGSALTAIGAAGTGSAAGAVIKLQTAETTVVDGDYLGRIEFSAPSEASGTDAILTGAQIHAEADDTFGVANNETELVFSTASSDAELGSATSGALFERMRITSSGNVGIGTAVPSSLVEIYRQSTDRTNLSTLLTLNSDGDTPYTGYGSKITWNSEIYNTGHAETGYIGIVMGAYYLTEADMVFATRGSSSLSEKMRISGSGSVGIGTILPQATGSSLGILHVENQTTSSATQGASIRLSSHDSAAVTGAGHRLGVIDFVGEEDASDTLVVGAKIEAFAAEAFTATGTLDHNSKLHFSVQSGTSGTDQLAVPAMVLDAHSRISLSNNDTGASNTIFGKSAGDSDGAGDFNVFIGDGAAGTGTQTDDADGNVGVGYNALQDLTQGAYNTSIGWQSGLQLLTGNYNVFVGNYAGEGTTAGEKMTFVGGAAGRGVATADAEGAVGIGYSALNALTSGERNTAVGYQALLTQEDGDKNTAIGYQALKMAEAAVDGYGYNTAVGSSALTALTTGTGCVAVGADALLTSTDGDGNVAIGYNALKFAAVSEDFNIAIGYEAMVNVDEGTAGGDADNNIAIGLNALAGGDFAGNNRQLQGNIAIGTSALDSTGANEQIGTIAIGHQSLTALTSGAGNTAVGYQAGKYITDGGGNTILGYNAYGTTTSGTNLTASSDNTAIGKDALGGDWADDGGGAESNVALGSGTMVAAINGANHNVAIGRHSQAGNISGDFNISVGSLSGDTITTGTHNILLGYHSEASAVDVTYEIVIGTGVDSSNAFAGAGTETVKIGRASDFITCDFGENATWSHSSDIRIKKDIEDSELGLSFINDLRPVIYKKKAPSEYPKEFTGYDENETERKNPDKKHYGFIAQEVKEAMDKAGHSEFPVWSEGKDGMQELGETELITPLIKAVQELSAEVASLKEQLENN